METTESAMDAALATAPEFAANMAEAETEIAVGVKGVPFEEAFDRLVEERVLERTDLLDRFDRGDTSALGEIIEHATGAKIRSVKVDRGA